MDEKPAKRFQWSLRDIFFAVLVVALASGWWIDRQQLRREYRELMEITQQVNEDLWWYMHRDY